MTNLFAQLLCHQPLLLCTGLVVAVVEGKGRTANMNKFARQSPLAWNVKQFRSVEINHSRTIPLLMCRLSVIGLRFWVAEELAYAFMCQRRTPSQDVLQAHSV